MHFGNISTRSAQVGELLFSLSFFFTELEAERSEAADPAADTAASCGPFENLEVVLRTDIVSNIRS